MAVKTVRRQEWEVDEDDYGHRDYTIKFLVTTDAVNDGPAVVIQAPGLPAPGATWAVGNDIDVWAFCQLKTRAKRIERPKEPGFHWEVEKHFSTRAPVRCNQFNFTDPLVEPPKVFISTNKYTEEASIDRFGLPITNSAWEMLRGHAVEFDGNRTAIKIVQNVATPYQGYQLPAAMLDTVNAFPIWGFKPRCVKLSEAPCERKFYNLCYPYYERSLTFDVNTKTFDRDILDEGSKVLRGHWLYSRTQSPHWIPDPNASPYNPQDFIRYYDNGPGNVARVILNGLGSPAGVVLGTGTGSIELQPILTPCCPTLVLNRVQTLTITDASSLAGVYTLNWDNLTTGGGDGWKYYGPIGDLTPGTSAGPTVVFKCVGVHDDAKFNLIFPNTPADTLLTTWSCMGFSATFICDLSSFGGTNAATCVVTSTNPAVGPEDTGGAGTVHVEKYSESDMLLLGVPVSF